MRVVRNHQATLSATRASSEGEMRAGAGECGADHPEDRLPSAMNLLSYFERSAAMGRGPPRLAQGGSSEGGRARVPSLG